MSASQQGSESARPGGASADAESSRESFERALLDRTLEYAEQTLNCDDPLAVADVEAMLQVGRRRAGWPLALEPVAVELVESILRAQFGSPPAGDGAWLPACRQIAETLLEDPPSRARLEALWSYISGGAP